jgi:hypothetical protein
MRSKVQDKEIIAAKIRMPMHEREVPLGHVGHRPGSRPRGHSIAKRSERPS